MHVSLAHTEQLPGTPLKLAEEPQGEAADDAPAEGNEKAIAAVHDVHAAEQMLAADEGGGRALRPRRGRRAVE